MLVTTMQWAFNLNARSCLELLIVTLRFASGTLLNYFLSSSVVFLPCFLLPRWGWCVNGLAEFTPWGSCRSREKVVPAQQNNGLLDHWKKNKVVVTHPYAVCSQYKWSDHCKKALFYKRIFLKLISQYYNNNLNKKICFFVFFFVIAPRCSLWPWCFCCRCLLHVLPRFHTCCCHQDNCLHQIQF